MSSRSWHTTAGIAIVCSYAINVASGEYKMRGLAVLVFAYAITSIVIWRRELHPEAPLLRYLVRALLGVAGIAACLTTLGPAHWYALSTWTAAVSVGLAALLNGDWRSGSRLVTGAALIGISFYQVVWIVGNGNRLHEPWYETAFILLIPLTLAALGLAIQYNLPGRSHDLYVLIWNFALAAMTFFGAVLALEATGNRAYLLFLFSPLTLQRINSRVRPSWARRIVPCFAVAVGVGAAAAGIAQMHQEVQDHFALAVAGAGIGMAIIGVSELCPHGSLHRLRKWYKRMTTAPGSATPSGEKLPQRCSDSPSENSRPTEDPKRRSEFPEP
ncbi:hypothetical protein GCM10010166_56330 [Couchioplanes caeruleus subsp. azureus]|nr:hypothetical protein GCM10010166_56330 [Couchioplanes caeruleus subsp. azureus]